MESSDDRIRKKLIRLYDEINKSNPIKLEPGEGMNEWWDKFIDRINPTDEERKEILRFIGNREMYLKLFEGLKLDEMDEDLIN